jgi:PAS domain S-box-containing protein
MAALERTDAVPERNCVTARRAAVERDLQVLAGAMTFRDRPGYDLEDSDALIGHVLESCPVPITLNRATDGKILYESPATAELLGYADPLEARSVLERWADPQDREDYLKRLRHAGAVDSFEVRFRKADGSEFICAVSSRLVEFRGEEVIVSGLFDLTELREAQAEVAHQREMLEQSAKLSAMGELLAGISHELNNPLSVLVVQAAALQESATDERTAQRAARIARAANRCARIVKSFLTMARQEPAELLLLDLNDVIEGALEVTAYSLRTAGIDVSLRLAKSLPPVRGDADQLRQVVTNLLINAHHALQGTEGVRRLTISSRYRRQDNRVIVKVKDNGPGVTADLRSRIFEPLFTTKDTGVGTGMGLSLCHRIMTGHGGCIALERGQVGGAVFVLTLPGANEGASIPALKESDQDRPGACRVLVVDDEQDLGLTLSEILEQDGHIVDCVTTGASALEKLRHCRFDVILSDIRMPGMDGPSLYRTLRRERPDLIKGFAFTTGDTLTPGLRDFIDSTERPCIEKPITPRDVRQVVKLILRSQAR